MEAKKHMGAAGQSREVHDLIDNFLLVRVSVLSMPEQGDCACSPCHCCAGALHNDQ